MANDCKKNKVTFWPAVQTQPQDSYKQTDGQMVEWNDPPLSPASGDSMNCHDSI